MDAKASGPLFVVRTVKDEALIAVTLLAAGYGVYSIGRVGYEWAKVGVSKLREQKSDD